MFSDFQWRENQNWAMTQICGSAVVRKRTEDNIGRRASFNSSEGIDICQNQPMEDTLVILKSGD